jgi:predicted dehydrogenase
MTLESVRGDWRDYYRNISAVLNEGAELAVKPEEARDAVLMVEASVRSAETGQPVKVE